MQYIGESIVEAAGGPSVCSSPPSLSFPTRFPKHGACLYLVSVCCLSFTLCLDEQPPYLFPVRQFFGSCRLPRCEHLVCPRLVGRAVVRAKPVCSRAVAVPASAMTVIPAPPFPRRHPNLLGEGTHNREGTDDRALCVPRVICGKHRQPTCCFLLLEGGREGRRQQGVRRKLQGGSLRGGKEKLPRGEGVRGKARLHRSQCIAVTAMRRVAACSVLHRARTPCAKQRD